MIDPNVLSTYITNNHTPQRAKLVFNAIETILAYDYPDIVPELETIILNDDLDNEIRQSYLRSTLVETLDMILKKCGIYTYSVIHDFPMLEKIASSWQDLGNEYLPDYVLENTLIDDESEPDLSKLYSAINLVSPINEWDFYEHIHSSSATLISDMSNILNSKVIPDLEFDDKSIVTRYREFIAGRAKGVVYDYVATGGIIGRSEYTDLLEMLSPSIETQDPYMIAHDVVSLILISDISSTEVAEVIPSVVKYIVRTEMEAASVERVAMEEYLKVF